MAAKQQSGTENVSLTLDRELMYAVRNTVHEDRETLTAFAKRAFDAELRRAEKRRGRPCADHGGPALKRGRPVNVAAAK